MWKDKNRAREYHRKYRLEHPEQRKASSKKYHLKHREQEKEYCKKYNFAHPEKSRERQKRYRLVHPDRIKEWRETHREQERKRIAKYYQEHKEQRREKSKKQYLRKIEWYKAYGKKWSQTPKGKEVRRETKAKRRNFGFVPLNDCFEGAEGHHINRERVIYIPKKLHQSINHSITANRNMEKINTLAYQFLQGGI